MRTPRLAVWLLRTLGSGDSIDALLGDLTEEREHGRGRAWFWRQAIVGILLTNVAEVRAHKLLILRAGIVACAFFWMAQRVLLMGWPLAQILVELYVPTPSGSYMATTYQVINGMKVVGVQKVPISWQTALYDPLLGLLFVAFAAAITGWIVAKLHMRLPAVTFVTAFLLAFVAWRPNVFVPPEGSRGVTTMVWLVAGWRPFAVFLAVMVGSRLTTRGGHPLASKPGTPGTSGTN